jgi:hypothetical protein
MKTSNTGFVALIQKRIRATTLLAIVGVNFLTAASAVTATVQEIWRTRVFEEPLVPVGDEPAEEENAALASALREYSKRKSPDDFSSLTAAVVVADLVSITWRPSLR